jgi:glucan endo-1,3-alpha-glucosidase
MYETNVYWGGDLAFSSRMANILNMSPRPDFILVQTWNDGPESHNIGNLWPEQNTDIEPSYYMENHTA